MVRWVLKQILDLVTYWVVPFFCFLLPANAANAVIRFLATKNWLFRRQVFHGLQNVAEVDPPENVVEWARICRTVQILETVDIWHATFSSDRRILNTLVTQPSKWPATDSILLLGLHAGPGTLILRCIAAAGYAPRIVYRDISRSSLKSAPFLYLYQYWRIRYMRKICNGRAIRVPGGGKSLKEAMNEPGTALFLVPDAPAIGPRGDRLKYKGHSFPIDSRGLAMAVERETVASHFLTYWDDEVGRRVIEITPPKCLSELDDAVKDVNDQLKELLERRSAQWGLWTAEVPVFS